MKTKFLIGCALAMGMLACKTVEIQNGRVPAQYLPMAQPLAGTYQGEFDGNMGDLTLTFEGDKPMLSFHNNAGHDLFNGTCASSIGDLKTVYFKGSDKNPQLKGAKFVFNPGSCAGTIEGRELAVKVEQSSSGVHLHLALISHTEIRQDCDLFPGPSPNIPPYQRCMSEQTPVYVEGDFVK